MHTAFRSEASSEERALKSKRSPTSEDNTVGPLLTRIRVTRIRRYAVMAVYCVEHNR
jgi:hypothetical protein